jgi:hypothetical protein
MAFWQGFALGLGVASGIWLVLGLVIARLIQQS